MYKEKISIRKFKKEDIDNKIRWINDSENNEFLHYDLPLEYEKTLKWFMNNKDRMDRFDAVIEYNAMPVGIIGLLNIDYKNKKAEFYITVGEKKYKGKGIAYKASTELLKRAFNDLGLNKIYLYTETENKIAQKLFSKLGFIREGLLKQDMIIKDKKKDRYIYAIFKNE